MSANNTANVSTGGGVRGGYLFSAPITSPVPHDYLTPLDESYRNVGYITSDGAVMSDTADSSSFTDLNGDTIASANASESHTFAFTLAEVRLDSLAEQYGHKNVTDADGLITIEGRSGGFTERIYVAELVFANGRRGRYVIPCGQHQSTGDLTVNSTTLFSRQVTVLAMPDESGASFYYYIESTETNPPAKPEVLTEGTVLGKDVSTLGTFEIDGTVVSGTANKIEDYKEFSSNSDEQSGYYAPLNIEPWEGVEVVSSRNPDRRAALKDDGNVIVYLGKEDITPGLKLDVYTPGASKVSYTFDVTKSE